MSRNVLGTNVVTQVALVVRNAETTAAAWAELLGVDPLEIGLTKPDEGEGTMYRGRPTQGRAKLAFFDLGSVRLEIIEPVGGPSTWAEHLDRHGEGVHHIAFRIQGMDEKLSRLAEHGLPTVQAGYFTGGRYGYVGSEPKLGVVLELLEHFG